MKRYDPFRAPSTRSPSAAGGDAHRTSSGAKGLCVLAVHSFWLIAPCLFVRPAQAVDVAPTRTAEFSIQGTCSFYGYSGAEAGLEGDFEAFWNAHPVCGGSNCGSIDATVNTAQQTITWDWSMCGQATRSYAVLICGAGYTLTGGVCVQNGTPVPQKNEQCGIGNPCNPATGDKWQEEVDYISQSPSGLSFRRTFHSAFRESGRLGPQWHDNYLYPSIKVDTGGGLTTATVRRPGGRHYHFTSISGAWTPDDDIPDRLTAVGAIPCATAASRIITRMASSLPSRTPPA